MKETIYQQKVNNNTEIILVGEVVYGETVEVHFTNSDRQIKYYKFDCPCIKSKFDKETNTIIATFVGNKKPIGEKSTNAFYELNITYPNNRKVHFDLVLKVNRL